MAPWTPPSAPPSPPSSTPPASDAGERDHVLADFDRPATIEDLARQARDPMLAAQLYAAAAAAVGEVSAPERIWLDRFGAALRLDKSAQAAIEKRLGG
jgi:uncharacterized membrane protein YebE (DUF533 family)